MVLISLALVLQDKERLTQQELLVAKAQREQQEGEQEQQEEEQEQQEEEQKVDE